MTQDQINEWAKEAGFHNFYWTQDYHMGVVSRFAALVAQHEREQCALVCDHEDEGGANDKDKQWSECGAFCAAAIRARSEK